MWTFTKYDYYDSYKLQSRKTLCEKQIIQPNHHKLAIYILALAQIANIFSTKVFYVIDK